MDCARQGGNGASASTICNSSLYIGGNFNTFGSATSAKIAAYNTTRGCFNVGTTGLSGTSPSVYTFSVK